METEFSSDGWTDAATGHARYWDELSGTYQAETRISTEHFHYGPLIPGDRELRLLPDSTEDLHCLEIGCGAGQNSLVLTRQGARCVAVDVSEAQLKAGRELARSCGLNVEYRAADMDALPADLTGFDLIHSAYGFPFSADPESLVATCAERLRPGGTLLFSMGHPVYAGEWWELDDDTGIFLNNYFHPTPDVREGHSTTAAQARAFPVSECFSWCARAGLQVKALLEPAALPVSRMTPEERRDRVPYDSDAWAEQENELRKFPIVIILKAQKPENDSAHS